MSSLHFQVKEDNHLVAYWADFTGELITWDISASLESEQSVVTFQALDLEDSPVVLTMLPLPEDEYLIAFAGSDLNTIKRLVLSPDGSTRVTPPLERLNRVIVKMNTETSAGKDIGNGGMVAFSVPNFNYINGSYAYEPNRRLVIEAERVRNTINIFTAFHIIREEDGKYIQLYSYEGEALVKIPVPDEVSHYSFDPAGKNLYLLDTDNEIIVRYSDAL